MSDRFKFRAWDTKKRQWLEFIPPCEYMLDSEEWSHHDVDDFSSLTYPATVLNDTFFNGRVICQQCTGLKDKNGKLIFEGDVLRVMESMMYPAFNGLIFWDELEARFMLEGKTKYSIITWGFNCGFSKTLEIIGNIFENQHYLK